VLVGEFGRVAGVDMTDDQVAKATRRNDYRFTSERAVGACRTYAVQSISVLAAKP